MSDHVRVDSDLCHLLNTRVARASAMHNVPYIHRFHSKNHPDKFRLYKHFWNLSSQKLLGNRESLI